MSHEGRIWKMAAVTKLAAEDMIVVAETGRPPSLAEIVDVDLADFPELPVALGAAGFLIGGVGCEVLHC